MGRRLIAISGKLGAGKDTMVEKILSYLNSRGIKCEHLKFADNLKHISSILSGTELADQYSQEGKEKRVDELNMSIGTLQQVLGTVLREKLHPDIWTFPVLKYYQNHPDTVCIISDCRFKNEANLIKANGEVIVRLNRKDRNLGLRDPNHISEIDLDDYSHFDLVIDNDGTVDEMVEKCFEFLKYSLD